jgi:hypothetical protein
LQIPPSKEALKEASSSRFVIAFLRPLLLFIRLSFLCFTDAASLRPNPKAAVDAVGVAARSDGPVAAEVAVEVAVGVAQEIEAEVAVEAKRKNENGVQNIRDLC